MYQYICATTRDWLHLGCTHLGCTRHKRHKRHKRYKQRESASAVYWDIASTYERM